MQVRRYLFLILLALALDCCSERQFDSKTEGEKLLRRDAEWADLATAGKDVEKVVSYWTEDAVLLFPGQPVFEGKAAIRAYVTASFNTPGFKIHWLSQNPVFSPDGNWHTCEARTSSRCLGQMAVPSRCTFVEYQSGV